MEAVAYSVASDTVLGDLSDMIDVEERVHENNGTTGRRATGDGRWRAARRNDLSRDVWREKLLLCS